MTATPSATTRGIRGVAILLALSACFPHDAHKQTHAQYSEGAALVSGIALEFAQGAFTATRMADPADAMANAAGVALGLLTALTPWRDALLERFR